MLTAQLDRKAASKWQDVPRFLAIHCFFAHWRVPADILWSLWGLKLLFSVFALKGWWTKQSTWCFSAEAMEFHILILSKCLTFIAFVRSWEVYRYEKKQYLLHHLNIIVAVIFSDRKSSTRSANLSRTEEIRSPTSRISCEISEMQHSLYGTEAVCAFRVSWGCMSYLLFCHDNFEPWKRHFR